MELTRARVFMLALIVAAAVAVVTVILKARPSHDLVLQIEPVDRSAEIRVYLGGAVRNPGLYTVARGTRLAEALDRADLLPDADISSLPMADPLRDGQEVFVPKRIVQSTPAGVGTPRAATVVNINVASAAELETLPGIGPVLAERIIAYRTEHGPFPTLEALEEVRGISSRMVEDLRGLATAGE